jgi:hypothetical protein
MHLKILKKEEKIQTHLLILLQDKSPKKKPLPTIQTFFKIIPILIIIHLSIILIPHPPQELTRIFTLLKKLPPFYIAIIALF